MAEVNLRELDREALIEHQLAGYQKLPDLVRLWRPLFGELATGKPVDPARVAALAGLPLDRTLAVLNGGEWEPAGERLVGLGLTSIETPHRVEMGEVTMWGWCAPDALMIPLMIGKAARIQSPCAATGDPIRVRTHPYQGGARRAGQRRGVHRQHQSPDHLGQEGLQREQPVPRRRSGLGLACRQPHGGGLAGGRHLRALPRGRPATPSMARAADRVPAEPPNARGGDS